MLVKRIVVLLAIFITQSSIIKCQEKDDFFDRADHYFFIDIDSSIFYLKKGIPYYKKAKDWENYINCYNGLASCYSLKGEITASHFYTIQAEKEAKKYLTETSESAYGALLNNLAKYAQDVGDFEEAINKFHKTLEFVVKNNDGEGQVVTLNNLGICYYKSGDFEESERFYIRSTLLSEDSLRSYNTNRLNASLGLANLYKEQNKRNKALKLYEKVLYQLKQNPAKELSAVPMIEIHEQIGEILLDKGTKNDFQKNISELNRIHNKTFNGLSKNALILSGKWAAKNKSYVKAIELFNHALKIEQASNKNLIYSTKIGNIHFLIGNVLKEQQKFTDALFHFQNALDNFKIVSDNSNSSEVLENAVLNLSALNIVRTKAETHFEIYENSQNLEELQNAKNWYIYSIKLLNKIRKSYKEQGSKENLLKQANQIFEGLLSILNIQFKNNPTDLLLTRIYEIFENSKAIILLESIKENTALGSAGIPDSLIAKEQNFKQTITYHKVELAKITKNDTLKYKTIKRSLFDLETEYRELTELFESQYPKYYELKYNDNFNTLEDGKKLVSNDQTALLNYFVGENHIYILSITNNKVDFHKIKKPDNFNIQIENLRDLISSPPSSNNHSQDFERFQTFAFNLYELLISTTALPSSINKLIILPDDILSYIPFEILLSKKPEVNNINYKSSHLDYLVEDYQVSYLYSTTLLKDNLSRNRNKSKDIIGFAPSFNNQQNSTGNRATCNLESLSELACNEIEAESVANLFEGDSYIGTEANTENFNAYIKDYRIAHFATHSCLNDDDPMLNRIFFSDGYISNYDLYNLELNNEMAVLSACNTGSGALRRGEGVMSLSRGFIHAGCPSVLMSLWSVEDCTTSDIMVGFYKELKTGKTKDLALRSAKLNYLNQANRLESHPFYWAPFVHIGNTAPMDFSPNSYFWVYGLLALLGVLLFTYFNSRKSNT